MGPASRTVRGTVVVCALGALAAVLAGLFSGHPAAGGALASGLVIGSANGVMAGRALGQPYPFQALSLGRLAMLSAAGLGVGLVFFPTAVGLVIAGLAVAQLALAGVAAREALRR